MSPFELLLVGMAAHRLWAIWLTQEIALPVRAALMRRGGWIGYLASCPFCTSVWAGAAALALWAAVPYGRLVVLALAAGLCVAVIQVLFGLVEKLTFWLTPPLAPSPAPTEPASENTGA